MLSAVIAEDRDSLLTEAIAEMDGKLRSRVRAGARQALALLKGGPEEAIRLLEPLT